MTKQRTYSGTLFAAEVNADGSLASNYFQFGEAYPLSILLTEAIVKFLGRKKSTNGKVVGSKTKPADAGGSLTLFDYTARNIGLHCKGLVTTNAVSSSTLTAEEVTLGGYREWVEIGTEDLSSVVVMDETDATEYTKDVDYSIDEQLGLVAPLADGAGLANAVVHIDASGSANTDQRVTIGAGSSTKLAIKGGLIDDFDGTYSKVFLRMVRLVATNNVVLVSDPETEAEQLDFDLTLELPDGETDYGYIDGLPIGS